MLTAADYVRELDRVGYRVASVAVEPNGAGGWQCRCVAVGWGDGTLPATPHDDGAGNNLYEVDFDCESLPKGVRVQVQRRTPDRVAQLPGCHSREAAETMIREVADRYRAPDYAWVGGCRWLCKPTEFVPEPLRSALLRKHGLA